MKKFLYLLIFLPTICLADFYDVQWLSVTQDTHTAITTDWNYRGNMYFVHGDTTTHPLIADCTTYITIFATGTINALELDVSSATLNYLHVGTGGTVNYATSDGWIYAKSGIEVDGVAWFGNPVIVLNDYLRMNDDREILFGSDQDFTIGYSIADDQLRALTGSNVATDANVAWIITKSTWMAIGSTNTATASYMNEQGDLFIEKDLQVGGTFYYNSSYAHGYTRDVAVSVTGSTSTFVILGATWLADVSGNGFTVSGASCTYNGNGGTPKIFKVAGAFSAITDTANTVVYWALFKNGVLYESSIISRKIAVAGDVGAMSISTLVEMSTDDILDVRLSGDKAASITNNFVEFDIFQVN